MKLLKCVSKLGGRRCPVLAGGLHRVPATRRWRRGLRGHARVVLLTAASIGSWRRGISSSIASDGSNYKCKCGGNLCILVAVSLVLVNAQTVADSPLWTELYSCYTTHSSRNNYIILFTKARAEVRSPHLKKSPSPSEKPQQGKVREPQTLTFVNRIIFLLHRDGGKPS